MHLEIDTLKTSSIKVKQLFLDPFGEHMLITCGSINSSQLFYATKQVTKLKLVSSQKCYYYYYYLIGKMNVSLLVINYNN